MRQTEIYSLVRMGYDRSMLYQPLSTSAFSEHLLGSRGHNLALNILISRWYGHCFKNHFRHTAPSALKSWVWHCGRKISCFNSSDRLASETDLKKFDSAHLLNSLNYCFEGKTALIIFNISKYITRLLPLVSKRAEHFFCRFSETIIVIDGNKKYLVYEQKPNTNAADRSKWVGELIFLSLLRKLSETQYFDAYFHWH